MTIAVYNILGQKVKTLVNEAKSPGSYQTTWDGTDQSGNKVSAGVHFYRLKAGDHAETKKMPLLK